MAAYPNPRIFPLGDAALIVEWGERLDPELNRLALAFGALARELPGVTDCVPAYASVVLHYDPLRWTYRDLAAALRFKLVELPEPTEVVLGEVAVPVCYGGEHGPDLDAVAAYTGVSTAEVVARHTAADYTVAFIGFMPGFPYLIGMDPVLATPRRPEPRLAVPSGAVGIADAQTGVYPQASPGGWQLIGRTPLRLFDAARTLPSLLQPGDRVRFAAIDPAAFDTWPA